MDKIRPNDVQNKDTEVSEPNNEFTLPDNNNLVIRYYQHFEV